VVKGDVRPVGVLFFVYLFSWAEGLAYVSKGAAHGCERDVNRARDDLPRSHYKLIVKINRSIDLSGGKSSHLLDGSS
jgi:hypothetical protein